jgi:hypothetical protein
LGGALEETNATADWTCDKDRAIVASGSQHFFPPVGTACFGEAMAEINLCL